MVSNGMKRASGAMNWQREIYDNLTEVWIRERGGTRGKRVDADEMHRLNHEG